MIYPQTVIETNRAYTAGQLANVLSTLLDIPLDRLRLQSGSHFQIATFQESPIDDSFKSLLFGKQRSVMLLQNVGSTYVFFEDCAGNGLDRRQYVSDSTVDRLANLLMEQTQ